MEVGKEKSLPDELVPISTSSVPGAVVDVSVVNVGRWGIAWYGPDWADLPPPLCARSVGLIKRKFMLNIHPFNKNSFHLMIDT